MNGISIHETSPQQLNQSQLPYPQHFNTSLNSSSVSPSQPVLNPFLTSALIQTPSSPPPPTPSFQMPTSQDDTATLINSYLTLISQSQAPSAPPLIAPNPSSQHIYPNSHILFRVHFPHLENLITHHPHHLTSLTNHFHLLYPQNHQAVYMTKLSFCKKKTEDCLKKMVLMRLKKRQQSHEIEILEDKLGQLKRTNKEMKRKIVTLQRQQDDQTNLMTQQIQIQREMQTDIQQLFHSYEGKKAGRQMVVSN